MLSLRQIQQFLAVAETMNFRRAADRLNMAQPPLTAAIRQMEVELGVRLFDRTNRIIGLTAAGKVLREESLRTLAQAERAMTLTRRAGAGMTGSLRIGFVATAVRHIVPPLIARFRETHSDVALDLVEAPTARQIAALTEDRLDLGIVTLPLPSGTEQRIATRSVLRSKLVAAIPGQHRLAGKSAGPLALSAMAREPWILFPAGEGPGLHGAIERACMAAGFTPQVAQRAVQMETIVGLVAAGLGVALVPELLKDAGWKGALFRDLKGPGTPVLYEVALAWRRDDKSPALNALLLEAGAD